ncbi:MAG TPA: ATP-dependent DNA helicase RecG [Burkholderiales bacterium]|nr:ATP-dependent DNA helicase RecG [Burkholderiales bacterium]
MPGLNKASADKLMRLGITRGFDLVLHLPLRYDDETRIYPISDAPSAQDVLVQGRVVEADVKYRPRRQLVCHIEDGSGVLTLRFFNFYPSQVKQLEPGALVRAFGEIRQGFFGPEMVHPRCKPASGHSAVAKALTPVYPTTAGLGQDALRRIVTHALAHCDLADTLPEAITAGLGLPRFRAAIAFLHNPPPEVSQEDLHERVHPAWRRVKFDELLAQQLSMRLHYRRRKAADAPVLRPKRQLTRRLLESLPFALTAAQRKALSEVERDLDQPYPMQRLLQGDVGSGKTIVAALAALQAVENGGQVAIMAPTEILAEQHYRKFSAWLTELGITVTRLAGGLRKSDKQRAVASMASGATQIGVGTHALFQEDVSFDNLVLAIIDEQHRFGVHQRLALRMKGTRANTVVQPHQLMMSATPIPRTLAMSYYADLDVSVIDELPPGRTPVATRLVSDTRRQEVIYRVRDACMSGSQAYWVCPLIEESETLQLKTALETYESVRAAFPELKVGLVHGRIKAEEKAAVMAAFQRGDIHLLVATTVIEVGVDVPNATLMIIEHAERMGLSQLHQLRGRVGRGASASTCILLFQNPLTPTARERLKIIYDHRDGFEVARHDLRLRGPGEMLGARQSGLPMLRFADLNADLDLLEAARVVAERLLRDDPDVAQAHLARWLGGKHELLKV